MTLNRLLVLVGQLTQGGLERQLLFLIHQLQQQGVKIKCVVWNFEEKQSYVDQYYEALGDSLIGLENNISTIKKIRILRNWVKEYKPDVLLSFSGFTNFPAYIAGFGFRTFTVGSLRNSARYHLRNGDLKSYINLLFPKHILVNSFKALQECNQLVIFNKRMKLSYYPNVIDLKQFNMIGGGHNEFTSISIGNAIPQKKLHRLVEVISALQKSNVKLKHYHLGGGLLLKDLKNMAMEKDVNGSLKFLGPKDNVIDYLSKAQLFLHFSDHEGSPNVIMEAMAAGLPIITTECGDVRHYVENGINGFVVSYYSESKFSKRIKKLMGDTDLRDQMAESSRDRIGASDVNHLPAIFKKSMADLGLTLQYPLERA